MRCLGGGAARSRAQGRGPLSRGPLWGGAFADAGMTLPTSCTHAAGDAQLRRPRGRSVPMEDAVRAPRPCCPAAAPRRHPTTAAPTPCGVAARALLAVFVNNQYTIASATARRDRQSGLACGTPPRAAPRTQWPPPVRLRPLRSRRSRVEGVGDAELALGVLPLEAEVLEVGNLGLTGACDYTAVLSFSFSFAFLTNRRPPKAGGGVW